MPMKIKKTNKKQAKMKTPYLPPHYTRVEEIPFELRSKIICWAQKGVPVSKIAQKLKISKPLIEQVLGLESDISKRPVNMLIKYYGISHPGKKRFLQTFSICA